MKYEKIHTDTDSGLYDRIKRATKESSTIIISVCSQNYDRNVRTKALMAVRHKGQAVTLGAHWTHVTVI